MGGVSFLVPYRADGGPRDEIWHRAQKRLELLAVTMQDMDPEIIVADDGGDDPGLFNHPRAINRCARQATGDVFVIIDADTTFADERALVKAIQDTQSDSRWRLPETYITLTEDASRIRLKIDVIGADALPSEIEWRGDSVSWSGIVIIPAEAFWKVGGADERYAGWGADDVALGLALDALYGKHVRYPGTVLHFWHPRGKQEKGLHRHADDGRILTQRYVAAAEDAAAIQAIVDEKTGASLEQSRA